MSGKIHVGDGAFELTAKTNSADLVDRLTAVRSDNVNIACDIGLSGRRQLRFGEKRENKHVFALLNRIGGGKLRSRIGRGLLLLLPIRVGCDNQPTAEAINSTPRFSVGCEVAVFVAPEALIGERGRSQEK